MNPSPIAQNPISQSLNKANPSSHFTPSRPSLIEGLILIACSIFSFDRLLYLFSQNQNYILRLRFIQIVRIRFSMNYHNQGAAVHRQVKISQAFYSIEKQYFSVT